MKISTMVECVRNKTLNESKFNNNNNLQLLINYISAMKDDKQTKEIHDEGEDETVISDENKFVLNNKQLNT